MLAMRRSLIDLRAATLLGLLLLWSCEGSILGPRAPTTEGTPEASGPKAIECAGAVVVAAEPMLRLTRVQYEQTLRDLLADFVGGARAQTIADGAFAQATLLPDDPTPLDPRNRFRKLYRRYSRDVDQLHIDGWYQVASWVSGSLMADRAALLGSCATATAATDIDACVRSFISRFGARALRHPLPAEDLERYAAIYGDTTVFDDAGLHDVVAVMLQAPEFIYLVESGAEAVDTDVYALTDFELASRLSYAVWDSAPDAMLLASAAAGELRTSEGRRAQLERMFDDPRASSVIARFADDWMRVSDVPEFTAKLGQVQYDAFVGGDRPTSALSIAARQELRTMVGELAFAPGAHVTDLLTSTAVFPATDELAKLYGLAGAWNGSGAAPTVPERPGVFTRIGLLGTGLSNTRPIIKGVFITDQLLCDELPTPPAGAANQKVTLAAPYTTRQYLEALTEQPTSACAGCHKHRLNSLGFATEMFDGLGRLRSSERFFDETGALVGALPVDTTAVLQLGEEPLTLTGPADLARALGQHHRFEACVAKQMFRYTFSRPETAADACTLVPMWEAAQTGSLRDVLAALAEQPSFTQRRIEEVAP